jgi:hypothetical protein
MEAKKEKNSKKADLELRKFSVEIASMVEAGFSISKADEIYKYLKTGIVTKTPAVTKK